MEYAIQLFLPVIGGLFLGVWLQNHYGVSPIVTVALAILGLFAGIGILYKRAVLERPLAPLSLKKAHQPHATSQASTSVHHLDALYNDSLSAQAEEDDPNDSVQNEDIQPKEEALHSEEKSDEMTSPRNPNKL